MGQPSAFMVDGKRTCRDARGGAATRAGANAAGIESARARFPEVPDGGAIWVFAAGRRSLNRLSADDARRLRVPDREATTIGSRPERAGRKLQFAHEARAATRCDRTTYATSANGTIVGARRFTPSRPLVAPTPTFQTTLQDR